LAKVYEKNENVIFISFAKNNADQLRSFLIEHPVSYLIFPTGKDEITKTFGVENYPVNIIIDKDGKYFLNSAGTGIGISYILKREIDSALNN
jgi:hypothetical protein